MTPSAWEMIQAGGVLAFATLVYIQLRDQTACLHAIKRMMGIQGERQKIIQQDMSRAGLKVTPFPEPKPAQTGTQ